MVLAVADDLRQDRLDRAVAVGGERLVGGAVGEQRLQLAEGREGEDSSPAAWPRGPRRGSNQAASVVSTPSGWGGVWAGARARKNQASKRVEITSGVIQRENSTSSSSAGSSIPASSASSRTAQAR